MNSLLLAEHIEDYVINLRRVIHQNPELSEQEFETQKLIICELETQGIKYEKMGCTSVVATIKGEKNSDENRTLAFRADIDALPMFEESDVPFKSCNDGVAHTCGHDAHAAILLGFARLLHENRSSFGGTVKLIFQEAEELVSGAKKLINENVMNDVDMIFALHCLNDFTVGQISANSGFQLAGGDTINMKWIGVSGHGSQPHLSKDSILGASTFVTSMQSLIIKNVSPQDCAVLSVGSFNGGQTSNIISKYCDLSLTMRYFKDDVQKKVHQSVYDYANGIARMYGLDVEIEIKENVKSVYNDPKAVQIIKDSFVKFASQDHLIDYDPIMSSEDFSEYLKFAPGAMFWLGTGNPEIGATQYPHHEKFKIDEASFKYGVATFMQIVVNELGK